LTPESEEEVLTSLGLTSSQARVYLALVHNGPSKVMLISQISRIHRAHLYQILRSLEEIAFVERKLGTGIYVAIPLKEVAPILVKNKRQEISKLETEVNEIVDCAPQRTPTPEDKPEIILISNKNRNLNKAQKYYESARSQIELIQTWKRFLQLWQYYEETFEDAMARGVTIRQIVEYPKDASRAQEFLKKKAFKNSLFELRFVSKTGGNFVIVDNGMLLLSTSQEKENLGETPFLFSNYKGLLGLMQRYFLLSWKTACSLTMLNKNNQKCTQLRTRTQKKQTIADKAVM
jgi:sugar-specific transcriptional regulator TrmB